MFVPRDSDLEAQQLGVIPRDPKEKTTGKLKKCRVSMGLWLSKLVGGSEHGFL